MTMLRCVFFMVLCLFCTQALSEGGAYKSSYSAEIAAGIGYSDRLRIPGTRPSLYKSDNATLVDAELEYEAKFWTDTELELSYNFSQREYDEITSSDSRYHYSLADLNHNFGFIRAGVTYSFLDFRFGGKPLLEVDQSGVYIERFLWRKLFLKAEYRYSENVYDNLEHLYSEAYTSGGEAVYYFNRKTYLLIGYKSKDEKAKLLRRNYDANKYKIQFTRLFKVGRYLSTFEVTWRVEDRDYEIVTKSISDYRNDRRHRYKLRWKVPVSKRLFTEFKVERSNYVSNVPWANYSRDVSSIQFGVEF